MRLEVIFIGVMMGLAFAAPPGIVTAETVRRGLGGGFAHALFVQVGSLVGDASYAIIALAGLAAALQSAARSNTRRRRGRPFLALPCVAVAADLVHRSGRPGGNRRELPRVVSVWHVPLADESVGYRVLDFCRQFILCPRTPVGDRHALGLYKLHGRRAGLVNRSIGVDRKGATPLVSPTISWCVNRVQLIPHGICP